MPAFNDAAQRRVGTLIQGRSCLAPYALNSEGIHADAAVGEGQIGGCHFEKADFRRSESDREIRREA